MFPVLSTRSVLSLIVLLVALAIWPSPTRSLAAVEPASSGQTQVRTLTSSGGASSGGTLAFVRHSLPLGAYSQVTEGNNVGDINGDGKPDVVVAGDKFLVWYQNPDWTANLIASGDRYGAGAMVLIADVNGDGRQDVITGEQAIRSCAGVCQTDWFENMGTGWVKHVLASSVYCHDLAWGDLNGDGLPDLACDDQQHGQVLWLQHPADPTQAWTAHVIDNRLTMGVQIADIDGDGSPDIVAGEAWYDNDQGWKRYPYSTMQGPVYPTAEDFSNFEKISVADVNGDGRPDIVATMFADNPQSQEWVFLAPQDPRTQVWTAVRLDPGPLFAVHSQMMADFDGSGRPQIAIGESDPGGWDFGRNPNTQLNIYTLIGAPSDPSGWQKTTIDVIGAHEMRTADLNGDGHPDLVADYENGDLLTPPQLGAIHWWQDNPNGAAVPPSNSTVPTVFGTVVQGQTLVSSSDGWTGSTPIVTTYQWHDCDASGNNCSAIAGATGASYLIASMDVGHSIRLTVTGTNSAGASSVTSAAIGATSAGQAPVNVSPPVISGTAQQDQALATSDGTWTNNPTSFTYQWQDCDTSGNNCTNITGATSQSYLLQAGDVGNTIRVVIGASNASGSAQATSAQTAVVTASPGPPINTGLPTISGTAQQGQALTASTGTWTNTPTSFAYQWQDCDTSGATCVGIGSATSSTYTLQAADVGRTLRVAVTATSSAGSGEATSGATAAVQASPPPTGGSSGGGSSGGGSSGGGVYPDLKVVLSSESAIASPVGSQLIYHIVVSDRPQTFGASQVFVDVTLPTGYPVTSTTSDRGTGCTTAPPGLVCDLDWISPGIDGHITIWGVVGQAGPQVATANVRHWLEEGNPADNTMTLTLDPATATSSGNTSGGPSSGAGTATVLASAVITGTPTVGTVLVAKPPKWSAKPSRIIYQWQLCTRSRCAPIKGANKLTLKITTPDAGQSVRLITTATINGTTLQSPSKNIAIRPKKQ